MIQGIGTDIVDLSRFLSKEDAFAKKILSSKEYEIYQTIQCDKRKREYIGGRFAGKEAFLKANGMGLGDIAFKDITILNKESGAPYLQYKNMHVHISIAHEKQYAIAYVMIEER